MIDSFMGEVYFRVSKHLGVPISHVIRNKFDVDMKLLIHKYSTMLRQEQKESKKIKEQWGELS